MKDYLQLCKLRISLFSALSAVMGFLLSADGIGSAIFSMTGGVFVLACGACALNQCQDRETDAIMPRTVGRPLPSGRIKPVNAVYFSAALLFFGSLLLLIEGNTVPFLLGLFAVVWYNGVYKLLKRQTAFAAVPGALVGALPPAIGWTAAGGLLADPRLAFLCFFFFMWQTPHFWLLLLDRGAEYEAAGLPSLTRTFRRAQLLRIIFVWTAAAAVSALLIGMKGTVKNPAVNLALCAASVWLVWNVAWLILRERADHSIVFRRMNIFALIVMALLAIDGLIRNSTL